MSLMHGHRLVFHSNVPIGTARCLYKLDVGALKGTAHCDDVRVHVRLVRRAGRSG